MLNILLWGAVAATLFYVAPLLWWWKLRRIPGPAPLPVFGNLLALWFLLKPQETYFHYPDVERRKRANEALSKNVFHYWLHKWKVLTLWLSAFKPVVATIDPQAVADVMGNRSLNYKAATLYKFFHPWLGTGLLTSNGAKWQHRRRLITPSFHFDVLRTYHRTFAFHAKRLAEVLDTHAGKDAFHIYPVVTLAALDIITETATGQAVDALSRGGSAYTRAVFTQLSLTFERMLKPWLWFDALYWKTPGGRKSAASLKVLNAHVDDMIQRRRELLISKGCLTADGAKGANPLPAECRTFLDVLLTSTNEDGSLALQDAGVREEVHTFVFEGHDTTAAAMTWCTYLVGCNPPVQQRLHEELDRVLGDAATPSLDDLKRLPYLNAVIKESLRVIPSVPFVARESKGDVKVGGYTVPAGTDIVVPLFGVHHNDGIWKETNWEFQPERWLDDKRTAALPTHAFVGFSAGARNCVGRAFAKMEEAVVLATLFKRFKFGVPREQHVHLDLRAIIRPMNGQLLVTCEER